MTFRIEGPLLGFRKGLKESFDPKYQQFKNRVLGEAMVAGWNGKAISLQHVPPHLSVEVFWNKGPRLDWSNLYKAIEDALFEQDRFVKPGRHSDVVWDHGKEYCIVTVEV